MKIVIEGKNIELTESLKDHVTDKLTRLKNHFEGIIKEHEVRVKLSVERNPRISKNNITEVTIFLDGKIIRSEQATEDMYASIDTVVDKLDRQIKKYKSKHYRSFQHTNRPNVSSELTASLPSELNIPTEEKSDGKLIKSKKFKLHPMTTEDAIHHLDMIDHDFYLFVNSATNQINTVYLRKDGNYGLIEPVLN